MKKIGLNILLILAVLILGYVAVNLTLIFATMHNKSLLVPDFSGMTVPEAEAVAAEMELRLEVTDSVYIRGMEPGGISRQIPSPGSKVKKNRRIHIVINSITPRMSTVPSVIGYSLRQARTELAANGLRVGQLTYQRDMATNNVLAQKFRGEDIEAGTQVSSGNQIDLVLGLNPRDSITYVPNVVGYKYNMATDLMMDNSLNIGYCSFDNTVHTYSDTLEAYVYSQFPLSSDSVGVRIGSPVYLFLSKDINMIPAINPASTDSTDVIL